MFHGSLDQGSISPTFYDQLLHVQIPKGQKDSQVISVILGTLVGSARVKTTHKMLVKLIQVVHLQNYFVFRMS